MAAGILNQPLNHEEVIETTQKVKSEFLNLVKSVVNRIYFKELINISLILINISY